ncbi:hypothetical protein B0H13DRAFT_1885374 [Mycena leptocephala]|nr:hypothetical protein B0H13DRAFT_1885374 [Mycena leptocephala]
MPLLHRIYSDKTHVSDSEPEREARRRKRDNSHSSLDDSSAPNSPLPCCTPLSEISNTVREARLGARCTIDSCLSAIEGDLAKIKDQLGVLCQKCNRASFVSSSPPSTPPPKRARIMHNQPVGPDSPSMQRVLTRAASLNITEREELLKSYGLHSFQHFLWTFHHSDPYAAASYDLLHYFDGG